MSLTLIAEVDLVLSS